MPKNESEFKSEFRRDLAAYSKDIHVWTNNDAYACGLPDFCFTKGWSEWRDWRGVSVQSSFAACEAKFVKKAPVREASKLLSHELTAGQGTFLKRVHETGHTALVLIGFPDVAVAVPYSHWPMNQDEMEPNITLGAVRKLRDSGYAIERHKGHWLLTDFMEMLREGKL